MNCILAFDILIIFRRSHNLLHGYRIMGLIKDVLGSALGSDQVKNGFGSNRFSLSSVQNSFSSSNERYSSGSDYNTRDSRMQNRSPNYPPPYASTYNNDDYRQQPSRRDDRVDTRYNNDSYYDPRPNYGGAYKSPQKNAQTSSVTRQRYIENNDYQDPGYSRGSDFHLFALPQIGYGDGQPFLRGYSNELGQYGLTFRDFIQALDSINIAIIPNPEAQIFQKGANIAGWFL